MAEALPDTKPVRDQAAALLLQARQQMEHLQGAIGMASGDPALRSRLSSAASQLAGVTATLSHALDVPSSAIQAADLAAVSNAIQAGEAGALIAEAASAAPSQAAAMQRVVATSAATRHEAELASHDLFERHVFEPYLHFSSAEDEAAFRQRETAAKSYISDQLARGTAEGTLNASGGELGYMLDAHAHGAGDSPDFMPRWNRLAETAHQQHDAMRAAGQSTEEFDRNLASSTRRFLKTKGLSNTEIDAQLAHGGDPLDAVKPYLGSDRESRSLAFKAKLGPESSTIKGSLLHVETSPDAEAAPAKPVSVEAVAAKLRAAGVQATETPNAAPAHGLSIQKPVAAPGHAVGG